MIETLTKTKNSSIQHFLTPLTITIHLEQPVPPVILAFQYCNNLNVHKLQRVLVILISQHKYDII